MKKVRFVVDGTFSGRVLEAFVLREISDDRLIVVCQDRIIWVRYNAQFKDEETLDVVVPIDGNILILDLAQLV